MLLKDRTKYLFADTLKEMLKTRSLHEIRISDLCEKSGTERQTFYYHFKDKYDLIAWIYLKDIEISIHECGGYYCLEQLEKHLLIMEKNISFYKKAFEDKTQNALMYYVREINKKITETAVKKQKHLDTLDDEMLFSINFTSHAWIGCIIDWVIDRPKISAKEYARLMYANNTISNEPILLSDVNIE